MAEPPKPLRFRGSALGDLRKFPTSAGRAAGYQLDKVQSGFDPTDCKLVNMFGPGVREIRIRDMDGAFRVIYVAKFESAIYVLHCFQKKTQAIAKAERDLAASRYRNLVKELNE